MDNNNQTNNDNQTLLSSMYGADNSVNQNTMVNNYQTNNNVVQNTAPTNYQTNNNVVQNTVPTNYVPNNVEQNTMANNLITITDENQNSVTNNNGVNNQINSNNSLQGNSNSSNSEALNIPDNVLRDELEKRAKKLNGDFLVLGIFLVIAILFTFSQGSFNFVFVIELIITIAGFIGSKEMKPYASVCGIIMGVLLIISLSLIDIVLGVFVLTASFRYNSALKKCGVKTKAILFSVLGIVAMVAITFVITYVDLYGGHELTCTRQDGDVYEITFDPDGISGLKINGEDASASEYAAYSLQFMNSFFFDSYSAKSTSEKIKIYRNIVTIYEVQENGATCK